MTIREWMHRPGPVGVGALSAAVCIALAVFAFTRGAVPAELALIALAAASYAFGALLGNGRGWPLWGAAAALLAAALWWAVHPVVAVAVVLAAVAASIAARRVLRRREDACRYLAKLTGTLAKATKDDRAPGKIIAPIRGPIRPTDETRQGAMVGLPIRWHVPAHVPVDDAARLLVLTSVAEVCKVPTTVRVGRHHIDVHPAPRDEQEETEERPADVERLNDAVRAAMGPELHVASVEREDDDTLAAFALAWPPTYSLKAENIAVRNRVLKAAGAVLGGAWKADGWDSESGRATFSRMAELPKMIPHPGRNEALSDRVEFATMRNGGTAYMNLSNENPHALIAGTTSTGKTSLMRTLLVSMPANTRASLVDPKRASMLGLDQLPVVESIATRPETMAAALHDFREEMLHRYELLETRQTTTKQLPPRVIVIDEAEMLFDILDDWWKTEEKDRVKEEHAKRAELRKKQAKNGLEPGETAVDDMPPLPSPTGTRHPGIVWLKNILQAGRQARMYVIMASQQTDASWLGTSARNQFSLRIAMSNLDQIGSRQVFGTMGAVSGLDGSKGRAWIGMGSGAIYPDQAQVWWVPELEEGQSPENQAILDRLGLAVETDLPLPTQPAPTDSADSEGSGPTQAPDSAEGDPAAVVEPSDDAPEPSPIPEDPATETDTPPAASDDHTESEASPQATDASTPVRESNAAPATMPELDTSEQEDRPQSGRETVTALDLEEGDIWWTDLGEGALEPVEVVAVEVDMHDVDLLEITYRAETGDAVVSIPEDEAVEREAR